MIKVQVGQQDEFDVKLFFLHQFGQVLHKYFVCILPTKRKREFRRRWVASIDQYSFGTGAHDVAIGTVQGIGRWVHAQHVDDTGRQPFNGRLRWCNFTDAFESLLTLGDDVSACVAVGVWSVDGGGGGGGGIVGWNGRRSSRCRRG